MQKLLLSGHAVETMKSLRAHGLSHGLLPLIDIVLEQPLGQRFIELALADTDLACARTRRFARVPVRDACCGTRCSRRGTRRRRGAEADPALVRRDGRGAQEAGEEDRGPRRFEARSRRSGRCSRASSSARASGRSG
jgi:hypothetical protein